MAKITIECTCDRSVEVEVDDVLMNEDWSPKQVTCECGERYQVNLHMEILGKEPEAQHG